MQLLATLQLLLLGSSLAAAAAIPTELDEHSIILLGDDGRIEIANKTEYFAAVLATNPSLGPIDIESFPASNASEPAVSKRCKSTSIIRQKPDSHFLNWDVPMSSVVKAGSGGATVAVTAGYQIANAIGVSASAQLTVVKDFLSATYGITYTETWTSTYAAAYTFPIPAGKYGVVVSNPSTTRKSGYVDYGCIGQGSTATYQADSYQSHAYGGLAWVTGTISLCTSSKYPVPRCLGGGSID
ncbi:celp0028 effector like protein [Rutstroemia sp. NJR-2017a WRK4]|nr:celp0028 effector like protein [Rutstroemia sp. NJR-2017a WRK4]